MQPELNIIYASSLAGDERLDLYRDLKDRTLAGLPERALIAEGESVVRRLLVSRCPVISLLLTPRRLESLRGELGARLPAGTPVFVASEDVIEGVVGFHVHRGVLAAAARPPEIGWRELAKNAPALVVLEDLTNHDNVGGIFRCVAALTPPGSGVLLSPSCCDPLYRKAIRVSMGHALCVPFARLAPWPDALRELAGAGFETVALTPAADAEPIGDIKPGRRAALLVGTEGEGLSHRAMELATRRVKIPMAPGVDSLNAMVACAVALNRLVSPA